jgi:hypothetical protein
VGVDCFTATDHIVERLAAATDEYEAEASTAESREKNRKAKSILPSPYMLRHDLKCAVNAPMKEGAVERLYLHAGIAKPLMSHQKPSVFLLE